MKRQIVWFNSITIKDTATFLVYGLLLRGLMNMLGDLGAGFIGIFNISKKGF